jgi:hypothetical protein
MKFQIPSSKFQKKSNGHRGKIGGEIIGAWSLEPFWNLEFGIWNFSSVAFEGGKR